ncbi:MAG: shikimate dehydrogenase [Clostridia bacterium]|nr:shikimate dehydrogenase [Clostridia bacterium]
MNTKHFAVIGHPIGHTMSPFIHAELFRLNGIDGDYAIVDIAPDTLGTEIPRLLRELDGFNVTIPYKSAVIPFLDAVEGVAKEYGSVNTVRCADRSGRTTDPTGFVRALAAADIPLSGHVAILGAGGVCRVFAGEAARAGCSVTFGVLESDIPSAEAIIAGIRAYHPDFRAEVVRITELRGTFDLLVNATPVGMYPKVNAMPVDRELLKSCAAVFDAVYNPENTALLTAAREAGCKAQGGMPMLVWQAAAAQEIWLGVEFDPQEVVKVIASATEYMNAHFTGNQQG